MFSSVPYPRYRFAEAVKIMVALSILFSYGLQFCVPSEIVWTRLEPWLRKRKQNNMYLNGDKTSSTVIANVIAGGNTTNVMSVDEKKQLELELNQQEAPMDGAYYMMRAVMILGTGTYIHFSFRAETFLLVRIKVVFFNFLIFSTHRAVFIAALVPDLAPFISLIGAVFFSILGLMCPAVIHLFAFWEHDDEDGEDNGDTDSEDDLDCDGDYYAVSDDADLDGGAQHRSQRRRSSGRSTRRRKGMSRWTMAKDLAIVLIALIALVSGTYASLVDIVAFYGAGGETSGHGVNVNGTTTTTTTIGPGPESAFLVAGETV